MKKLIQKLTMVALVMAMVIGTVGTVEAKAAVTSADLYDAEEIDMGEKIEGRFIDTTREEKDTYKFEADGNKITSNWYAVTFKDSNRTSSNNMGAKLTIYDADLNKLDYIEAKQDKEQTVYFKSEEGSVYYIVVSKSIEKNLSDYYFIVEEREDEAGESADEAASIQINKEYKNYFQAPSELDYYKFTVKTNEQKIKLKNAYVANDNVDHTIYWQVYDEDGVEVKDVRDTFNGCGAGKSKEYDVKLAPGEYFIKFKAPSYMTGEGKYVFSIEEKAATSQAEGAMMISAITMSKGDSITLEAVFADKDAKISWSTSKSSVVKVSSSGKLTAKKRGTAKITCKNKATGEKMVVKVTVK